MAQPTPFAGKHVVVLGAARQGRALGRWLPTVGARVTLSDRRPAPELEDVVAALRGPGVSGEPLGREYSSADHVVTPKEVATLLQRHGLLAIDDASFSFEEDLLV